jgi:hypothetical protein
MSVLKGHNNEPIFKKRQILICSSCGEVRILQSLANIMVHLIFSTKERFPFLHEEIQSEFNPYLASILKDLKSPLQGFGGMGVIRIPRALPWAAITLAFQARRTLADFQNVSVI